MTDRDSSEVLCEQIMANAQRETDDILISAHRDAKELMGKAEGTAEEMRLKRLDEARAEGQRRRELTLASATVEARRLRLERIETLLESMRGEAERRLKAREGFDYRQSVIDLITDAVRSMPGKEFAVRLSEKDRPLFDGDVTGDIASRAGRSDITITLSFEATMAGDGPIVEDATGRQVWDNRYSARLERLWPGLRRQIADRVFPDSAEGGTT